MRFSSLRNIYIRRALMAALIFAAALIQHTGIIPEILGVPAMILVPLTVCVAMYERSIPGMCFGVLAGILWDFASVRGDGFFAVILTAIGFVSGALVTFVFRNNIRSALIISFGSLLFCNISYWLMFILNKGYEGAWDVLFSRYLPSVLYSLIFTFIFYYIVSAIVKYSARRKK